MYAPSCLCAGTVLAVNVRYLLELPRVRLYERCKHTPSISPPYWISVKIQTLIRGPDKRSLLCSAKA